MDKNIFLKYIEIAQKELISLNIEINSKFNSNSKDSITLFTEPIDVKRNKKIFIMLKTFGWKLAFSDYNNGQKRIYKKDYYF